MIIPSDSLPGGARTDALLCFIHINKNAGNSLVATLQSEYSTRFRQYLVQGRYTLDRAAAKTVDCPTPDVREVLDEIRHQQWHLDAVSVNLPYGMHRQMDRSVDYVGWVREPVARCVSYWYWAYAQRHSGDLWDELKRIDWRDEDAAEQLPLQLRNDQTRFLSGTGEVEVAREHVAAAIDAVRDRFAFLGAVERYGRCLKVLADLLGWRNVRGYHLNAKSADVPDLLPPAAIPVLEVANAMDRELYDWVVREYLPAALA